MTGDYEREARYAEAIRAEVTGPEAHGDYVQRAARAAMAVADAENADRAPVKVKRVKPYPESRT